MFTYDNYDMKQSEAMKHAERFNALSNSEKASEVLDWLDMIDLYWPYKKFIIQLLNDQKEKRDEHE